MTPPPASPRALSRALAAAVVLLALAAPAAAETPERGDFDARPTGSDAPAPAAGEALRERLGRFGLVAGDERTGTPRAVAKLDGFLTRPSARDGAAIALDYVRENPRVFGLDDGDVAALRLTDRTSAGGVEYLSWEQRYRGIPSSDTQLDAAVTGAGRLLSVTGPAAPDLAVPSIAPAVSAEAAYAAVRRSGRAARPEVAVRERAGGAEQATTFADGGSASLVLYQDGDGAQLAWRVLAPVSSTEVYDATVDAAGGAVVRRTNRVDFAADAWVYPVRPAFPAVQESLAGLLDAGATTLKGPNAHAFVDASDRVGIGRYAVASADEVGSVSGDWKFELDTDFPDNACAPAACTWDPTAPGSWARNRKQSATQLFYLVNTFQAHLAQQPINFVTGGFSGDDPVLAQAMDGADGPNGVPDAAHRNNASFITLPDGQHGLLQSYLFSDENPFFGNLDAANDASIIYHELAHGLSERLVIDGQGFGALSTPQAGAIAEGTSDYYAMDSLVGDGLVPDAPDADVRLGRYLDGGAPEGLRYQAIDCEPDTPDTLCPATPGASAGGFTYGDFGKVYGAPEVHSDGEIWAQTLWDIRQALGVEAARRVITGALRISPPEPSFLDMRNAILQANTDADDEALLWEVFAARGMGYYASTDGSRDLDPEHDGSEPPDVEVTGTVKGVVRDEDGTLLAGVNVGISGHDTDLRGPELGPWLGATTAPDGSYEIVAPAATYPVLVARRTGYRDARATGVTIAANGITTLSPLSLELDWASAAHDAEIERHSGPDNADSGCGPGGLIDDDPGVVWGSDSGPGGQTVVVDLGAPIQVDGVAIDPGAGCGDDPTAGLGQYAVGGATGPDEDFRPLGSGTFGPYLGGFLRTVSGATEQPAVRFVELRAITPQSEDGDGAQYLDVAELHVARKPGTPVGPTTETGPPLLASTRTARLSGTVIPRAAGVATKFQYGTTTAYGSTITSASVPAAGDVKTVTRDLSGLQPNTRYHYRFVARRGGVDYPGKDATFTTASPVVPTPTPTPTATPRPTPTPAPDPPDDGPVVSTSFTSKRLTANKRGMFKVQWTFGDAAPSGKAKLRVVGKRRKRIATAAVTVRPGRSITKTLRLNRTGRKMIRRGRSRRVTLELRLPGGGTLRERVRLARKRR